MTSPIDRPAALAYRKACDPNGIGLSHYVLVINEPTDQARDTNKAREDAGNTH